VCEISKTMRLMTLNRMNVEVESLQKQEQRETADVEIALSP
jgi:hypothetical protein